MALSFESVTAANEYGFYCIPKEYLSREMPLSIFQGEVYEPMTLRFMRRHLGSGDVVTGGAFIGDFFPALCEVMASKAKLHSFEPTPLSFEAAQETIRLNGLKNVNLQPVAVGEEAGTFPLLIARRSGEKIAAGERIVTDQTADDDRIINVEVKLIDDLVAKTRKVSLLHLDIEGFEDKGLKGSSRILNDSKPLVILEAGKPWQRRNFLNILNEISPKAGYQLMGTMEHNAIYRAQG